MLPQAIPCVHIGLVATHQLQQMLGWYQLRAVSELDGLGQNHCVWLQLHGAKRDH